MRSVLTGITIKGVGLRFNLETRATSDIFPRAAKFDVAGRTPLRYINNGLHFACFFPSSTVPSRTQLHESKTYTSTI